MRAYYRPNLNCSACLDTAGITGGISKERCDYCMKVNTEEVTVLSTGDDFFGNKSTILHDNGKTETVYTTFLTIKLRNNKFMDE